MMMRNPVFESSMVRRMRSFRAPMLVTLYCAFTVLCSITSIVVLQKSAVTLANLRAGLDSYVYLSLIQFALVILVAPALTSGAIAGERERQTLDLLLCTRVSALSIVSGKLLSTTCFLALMIVASLPVMAVTLFFGGVTIGGMLMMELFLIVTAFACSAIGIFCSALFKRTVTATVVSYLTIFALGVGTLLLPFLLQAGQLENLMYVTQQGSSVRYLASGITISAPASMMSTWDMDMATSARVPMLFFLNPAIGLFSLLVDQTGLLRNTIETMMGYRGSQLFSIFDVLGSVAGINMIVLVVVALVLVIIASFLVKPSGRKARKRK